MAGIGIKTQGVGGSGSRTKTDGATGGGEGGGEEGRGGEVEGGGTTGSDATQGLLGPGGDKATGKPVMRGFKANYNNAK